MPLTPIGSLIPSLLRREERRNMKQRILTGFLFAMGMAGLHGWAEDAFIGNYEGVLKADRSQTAKATAKVIAEGPAYYRVVVQAEPLAAGDVMAQFEIFGIRQ